MLVLLTTLGCSEAEQPGATRFEVSGRLEDERILEASGLARSQRQADLLWVINDKGSPERVHATDASGRRLGEFHVDKSHNRDWEDLASFQRDGTPYLMIADIGDNDAKRKHRRLYFVAEPVPERKGRAVVAWKQDFRYPDGPRDAESAAVDTGADRALILSKRDLPPVLYAVPLHGNEEDVVVAERLGAITSLPKPSRRQIELAPKIKSWFWQPVGMDISADNRAAVVLTYEGIYYFKREPEQRWIDALNSRPLRISLGNFKNAESVAFADNQRTVVVTGENKHSRMLRIDLAGVKTK